jgi:hypothetical protein
MLYLCIIFKMMTKNNTYCGSKGERVTFSSEGYGFLVITGPSLGNSILCCYVVVCLNNFYGLLMSQICFVFVLLIIAFVVLAG